MAFVEAKPSPALIRKLAKVRERWKVWRQQQSDAYADASWATGDFRRPVEGVDYPFSPNHWWEQPKSNTLNIKFFPDGRLGTANPE